MISRIFIFILFSLLCTEIFAEEATSVLSKIKNLDFENAYKDLSSIEDKTRRHKYEDLTRILEKREDLLPSDSIEISKKTYTDPELVILDYLIQGNFGLYVYPYESSTYKYLIEAYELSNLHNLKGLQKLSVISILEYFQKFLSQSNHVYLPYLEEYYTLCEDKIDFAWYYIYSVILKTKTIYQLDKTYFEDHLKLDSIFTLIPDNHPLHASYNLEKGLKYQLDESLDSAESYYRKNLAENFSLPFLRYKQFASQLKISNLYAARNDYKTALRELNKSLRYVDKGYDTLRHYYHLKKYKADYLAKLNQYDLAYQNLKDVIDIGYDLDYKSNSIEVARLTVELDTEKKENQIFLEQQKNRNIKAVLIAAIGLLTITIGMSILIRKNLLKKKMIAEQENVIKEQELENLMRKQQLIGIDAMISGQEKERQKVADELHDNLGSSLATIGLYLDGMRKRYSEKELNKMTELIADTYEKIRGIAHIKNSGVLSDKGLIPAIRGLCDNISSTNTIILNVETFGDNTRLKNSLELTLFRIIQELLTNIIKHSKATEAHLQLTQFSDEINLIISDNGIGFKRSKLNKEYGMGLNNIEYRVEYMEGSFFIESIVGKGSTIIINLPL